MALIPSDVGIRMRMQNEANLLQPVTPAHELPSDLPELRTGQTFSARIQEVLPDNTYKALVAGKQLTLQLPEGAKAGDQLELVVVDRSAKVVIARQVESTATTAAEAGAPYPFAKFSPAARMIGQLLPAEGEAPAPAQLNRGQPLLAQPPQSQSAAVLLAPTLAKAVSQSGLFYESHQAQWVTGKLPLEQLLQEPQGQRSAPAAFQYAAAEMEVRMAMPSGVAERPVTAGNILQNLLAGSGKVGAGGTAPAAGNAAPMASLANITEPPPRPGDISRNLTAGNEKVGAGGTASPAANASMTTTTPATTQGAAQSTQTSAQPQALPDDLRPLVQQQLEAVATQRLFWHGEVWPQQPMDWEIEQDSERAAGDTEEDVNWRTSLSLTTPRLGRVDANLQLSASGVRITLATPYGASAADMRDEAPKLAAALAAAGVPLLGLQVKHEDEVPAPGTQS